MSSAPSLARLLWVMRTSFFQSRQKIRHSLSGPASGHHQLRFPGSTSL
jgi:hypothetical protein